MAKSEYHWVTDGEWVRPTMRGHHDQCCDCGLVHILDFRIVTVRGRQQVEYRARRHGRATGGARRPYQFTKDDD